MLTSKEELRKRILNSVEEMASVVGSTLGPKGRNVILFNEKADSRPIVTKDGVTVAKYFDSDDEIKKISYKMLLEAALKTNSEAGDGTTTSTVLAAAILRHADKFIASDVSPIDIKRGLNKVAARVEYLIEEMSTNISDEEQLEQVATISANGDRNIGNLIRRAISAAGLNGAVSIEETRSTKTSLEMKEGFLLDAGYLSHTFVTDVRRGSVEFDDSLIFVTDEVLTTVDDVIMSITIAAKSSRPLVIVAKEVEGQALAALVQNAVKGTVKIAAVRVPDFSLNRDDLLKDLAIATGATVVGRSQGLDVKAVQPDQLGECSKVKISRFRSLFVDGAGEDEEVAARVESIKTDMSEVITIEDAEFLQERITKLSSGVATIQVGAHTELEKIELKHRIEDALEAVRSSQEEGILPGGGVALFRISKDLRGKIEFANDDEELALKIMSEACKEPLRRISENSGENAEVIMNRISDSDMAGPNWGYDFKTGEEVDMIESGIIDPSKVTRCAIKNAVSIASTIIMADHCLYYSND